MLPFSLPPPSLVEKPKRPHTAYRPTQERPALEFRLIKWLEHEHTVDPLRFARPSHLILSDAQRAILVRTHPSKLTSADDITELLGKTPEWSAEWSSKIFELIMQFAVDFASNTAEGKKQGTSQRKRKRV